MDENADIEFTSKISFLLGITIPKPDFFKNLSRFSKFLWYLYVALGQIIFIINVIILTTVLFTSHQELTIVVLIVSTDIYLVEDLLKFSLFTIKSAEFSKVFSSLELMKEEFSARKDGFGIIHQYYYEPIKKFGKILLICQASSFTIYVTSIIVLSSLDEPESRKLLVESWVPFDPQQNPGYALFMLFQGLSFFSVVVKNLANDIAMLTILLSAAAQLKYMNFTLAKIYDDKVCLKDHVGETEMESLWWLKCHQRILGILEDFRPLCSYYLCIAYVAAFSDLVVAGLVITSPDLDWDIYKEVIFMGCVILQCFQLYTLALAADILKDCGLAAARNALSSKLIFGSDSLRRSFAFATVRSTKPIRFTAAGVNPLCSETFGDMIRLTVTYFVTIVQVRARYAGAKKTGSEALSSLTNN